MSNEQLRKIRAMKTKQYLSCVITRYNGTQYSNPLRLSESHLIKQMVRENRLVRVSLKETNNLDNLICGNEVKDEQQTEIERLRVINVELLEALKFGNEIIDRLCSDYAMVTNKHANYTRAESNVIENAIKKAENK
jgi:uncharacterized protein YfkK (UPF0435 family)